MIRGCGVGVASTENSLKAVDAWCSILQVYKGSEHPHEAQQPVDITDKINGRFITGVIHHREPVMSAVGPVVAKKATVAKFIFANNQSVLWYARICNLKSKCCFCFRGIGEQNFETVIFV